MAETCFNLEDEAFPSFLCTSLDSTIGRPTLRNVTLGSDPGLPVAASTVAKIRGGADDRGDAVEASYLDSRELQQTNSESQTGEHAKFALSFKDEMDCAGDFFAAHRLSDKLVKIHLDESAPKIQNSMQGLPLAQMGSVSGWLTELGTELSTGPLTFSQFGHKDGTYAKSVQDHLLTAPTEEDNLKSDAVDSNRFSNSDSSFLANEKLMSVDSVNSDLTDDDVELNDLPDEELERYFNKLVPAAMQRGRVEGQEIPASGPLAASDDVSNPGSREPERFKHQFHDDCEEDFQMPDVRVAATGMDSCPASDEDTEDELEPPRRSSSVTRRRLLPSTSRQLVGESNHPTFRPGLEGGSSDDESASSHGGPSQSGIEHRRSAEGQVINPPVTGDGGGGDGSSGSDGGGNDGGVAIIPLPSANIQTTYDALRGLGIVGSSAGGEDEDDDDDGSGLPGLGWSRFSRRTEIGDRVGPVGTGEELSSGGTLRTSHIRWSTVLDQKEVLDAVESTESGLTDERLLDSANLRSGIGHRKPQDPANVTVTPTQGTQMPLTECDSSDEDGVDEPDGAKFLLGLRGGPCGDASVSHASDTASEVGDPLSTSLESKYFLQSFHQDQEGSDDDGWNSCSDNLEPEFQKGADGTHGVVYQNEEGQWVTDLAYYTSFEKVVDEKTLEQADQFQTEDFVSAGDALEKIAQDQEEFEKEHLFMQEEQIEAASSTTFTSDSSWKMPTSSHILMRTSQVSSEFEQGDQSYLRLSLGQFFEQRSEALGCLGDDSDVFSVKRPSFGYIITSPERREPFPLIHPPEFSSRAKSPHDTTTDLSEADRTLKPEDLDETLEAPHERMSPKGDTHSNLGEREDLAIGVRLSDHREDSASAQSLANQSCVPPGNDSSPLLLSISTISSAIADASVSTDPSQLAAMILEWTKKSRTKKSHPDPCVGPAEEPRAAEQVHSEEGQGALMQRSTLAGELSTFDVEKYLKQTDVSSSSEASVAHATFDLTGWAEHLSSSHRYLQPGPPQEQGTSALRRDSHTQQKPTGTITEDGRGETTASAQQPPANSAATFPCNKSSARRSSIPRYRTSLGSDGRFVGSEHSSTLKASADSRADATTKTDLLKDFSEQSVTVEETQCNFRPSTSPVTHSSPSQSSLSPADGTLLAEKRPGVDVSPRSVCSSPSLSRLTYVSRNDGPVLPSPERQKDNCSMALSTTIIRFSPIPPVEPDIQSDLDVLVPPVSLDQVLPQHSKSLDSLPPKKSKSPAPAQISSGLSCTRSQSECSCTCTGDRNCNLQAGCRNYKRHSENTVRPLTKVDSGYCSNLNIQQPSLTTAPQISHQWGTGALSMPPAFSSDGLHYVPVSSFKPPGAGLMDLPHRGTIQSLLTGHSLFTSHLPQHYLVPDAPLHPTAFHMTAARPGLYSALPTGLPGSELTVKHLHSTSGPLRISGGVGPFHLPQPSQNQQDMGLMVKPYSQSVAEPLVASCLEEIGGQVVVPEELQFNHSCCVGIASQTCLSLFNPSERWQQVSITVTSLAIDGEKVDSLPYQWLIVKNKTVIGPKSTEDQKVLFLPPQAGVYQCVLSVSSWPASAGSEVAARAGIFAKKVVLIAIAEKPSLEVEVSESGILDFGDLPETTIRSLPLRLRNRTRATVPIRLVISANATAWPCFSFSKQSMITASDTAQHAGHMTQVSSSSVMNHVMHASCGETPLSFAVWVQFKAPQKYAASSGELGPADEYSARVDIELDCPGPSHVIKSIPLRARCGTARVHAPKDLQTVCLSAALGKSSQQMLPLKNAGNIDVQLKLESSDTEDCFSVMPNELSLSVGEEQGIVITFKAHGSRKYRESLLTILVLPSGPQYEVILKGEVSLEGSGRPAAVLGAGVVGDIPPILSNKQFVAWGGVALGRAVQQKLVLRNNSPKDTQQLRLIIRGQDQDCFQLQSLFSPEERLTRHGELSIRPKEDVTIHLLFAPTRVASILAKLEIKQSGVRPSQPGVKFTIPLSGHGGTSNIILEDQGKRADGYVATLRDVAVGRVSKVCLCVRNTGSRAAFIKTVVFTDVQTRSVMEPSVTCVDPSQFILKERTQEVITVLVKSTQREENLSQMSSGLLATLCLFCGDEVSRQQYRRLLQSKPDAGRKALSENSLLKNIDFSEKFLGEETVTEAFDLPQRPNEAHIFYGNMSKVAVSLLGSTRCDDCDQAELPLPLVMVASDPDGDLVNGNVSLDVLPVKGPQGPVLRVVEPSLKASEPLDRQAESWTVHPELLVLAAPVINCAVTTSQVRIQNNTSRELSFDLSWPAHCLTVTPQHGLIEPQCHLQILISPNPSLATKSALLPWSGQIYVQCDSQQKFIKVQVRRDLALDVSAAPAETSLSALAPQVATPVLPVAARFTTTTTTTPSLSPQTPQSLVEVSSKTILFPATPSGETSEAHLEVENRQVEVRWYLSSFAPSYVKGVDNTGDVYRATYTAFRCSKVSGTLGTHQKMQVPFTFLPRERGDYAQFWDLECHPVSEPQQKTSIRIKLCGSGIALEPVEGTQDGNCSLVKTEATVKSRKRTDASTLKTSQEESVRRGVYSPQDLYTFPVTRVGECSSLKVTIRNNSPDTYELKFVKPTEPFHLKHSKYSLRPQHYLKLPVQFKPTSAGRHAGLLLIEFHTNGSVVIQLTGEASL